tara:strand:+ start:791 stop:1057 length:267 start_codon:yes stop_codon:yes gene_type:complete
MSKLEFHRNGKVLHDKVIIGQIDKTDNGWHVSDVRPISERRCYCYKSKGSALYHFMSFESWGNYSKHGSMSNRVVRKNTELRQRFALT